jgi:hypothetical protein
MNLSAFQGEGYIAVGCTSGVYLSKRADEYCKLSELPLPLVTNSATSSFYESPGIQRTNVNSRNSRI